MENEAVTLSDGRLLGFRCLGDRDGIPLLFLHGTPGTRFVLSQDDAFAQIPGIYLILPERPGYGISDPQPDRVLLDYPRDIEQLTDHPGVNSFVVAGASGGGPHALACAYELKNRVTRVLHFSSPAPDGFRCATQGLSFGNRLALLLAGYAPWFLRWMMNGYASALAKVPDQIVEAMSKQRDWGSSLKEIKVPVYLWQREEDTLVSPNMARHLAAEIPDCSAHHAKDAGHLLTHDPGVVEEVRRNLIAGAV